MMCVWVCVLVYGCAQIVCVCVVCLVCIGVCVHVCGVLCVYYIRVCGGGSPSSELSNFRSGT